VRKTWILAVSAAVALVLAGCTSSSDDRSSSGSTSSGAAAPDDVALKTGDSIVGSIVVDAQGRTVYSFGKDTAGSGTSACSGECLANWPAATADSASPQVSDKVTGQVGTITRDDGSVQLTLNGLPLYLYTGDKATGDINGQAFQGVWWVVAADGSKVTRAASPSLPQAPGY
jgi:predicted lipoprotein with Yx(FWY)xxD motif